MAHLILPKDPWARRLAARLLRVDRARTLQENAELTVTGDALEVRRGWVKTPAQWDAVRAGAVGNVSLEDEGERLVVLDRGLTQYNVRLSLSERETVAVAAAALGRSMREFMREAVLERARRLLKMVPASVLAKAHERAARRGPGRPRKQR